MKKKLLQAEAYRPLLEESLEQLEEQITEHFGAERLASYREEEADFKSKVVDFRCHKDLANPYDLPRPARKSY